MGSQVRAYCNCGVNKKILIGGGMMTFKYIQYFPFLCGYCNDVVQANTLALVDNPPICPQCGKKGIIPYNDPNLQFNKGKEIVARSFNLNLNDGKYKCGKCGEFTLKFLVTDLMWD